MYGNTERRKDVVGCCKEHRNVIIPCRESEMKISFLIQTQFIVSFKTYNCPTRNFFFYSPYNIHNIFYLCYYAQDDQQ